VKVSELTNAEDREGAPVGPSSSVLSAARIAANDSLGGPPRRLSKAMEDEIYGLLGALLGMLEVLSIDVQAPLNERQRRFVNDALRFGDALRARVEGLVTLFTDEDDPRFQRTPYGLRRLIDHAIRAASWAAAEKGITILLPQGESWEADLLLVDAARVDRAVRSITDTLVAALGKDGQVELRVEDRQDSVRLTLSARPEGLVSLPALSLSAIMMSAWEHVFRLQHGSLSVDAAQLSVVMELPKAAQGDAP
jgi:hypothetical protein